MGLFSSDFYYPYVKVDSDYTNYDLPIIVVYPIFNLVSATRYLFLFSIHWSSHLLLFQTFFVGFFSFQKNQFPFLHFP